MAVKTRQYREVFIRMKKEKYGLAYQILWDAKYQNGKSIIQITEEKGEAASPSTVSRNIDQFRRNYGINSNQRILNEISEKPENVIRIGETNERDKLYKKENLSRRLSEFLEQNGVESIDEDSKNPLKILKCNFDELLESDLLDLSKHELRNIKFIELRASDRCISYDSKVEMKEELKDLLVKVVKTKKFNIDLQLSQFRKDRNSISGRNPEDAKLIFNPFGSEEDSWRNNVREDIDEKIKSLKKDRVQPIERKEMIHAITPLKNGKGHKIKQTDVERQAGRALSELVEEDYLEKDKRGGYNLGFTEKIKLYRSSN